MPTQIQTQVGPNLVADGAPALTRSGRLGDTIVSELQGRYQEQAYRGRLFMAHAIVTAPVIYSTAAGTGGPLIWNPPGSGVNVALLGVGLGVTVVTTVAAALGITGNNLQVAAPGSTTAIDSSANTLIGAAAPVSKAYRIGTPSNAGAFFFPFAHLHTGALTVDTAGVNWIDLGGAFIIPPGAWASVAASATASTTVASISALYSEVPL